MKSIRTKLQELVAEFYGVGVYLVDDADLPKLTQFFEKQFSAVLSESYMSAMMRFLKSEEMSGYDRQLKFYAIDVLKTAFDKEAKPDFLTEIDYPEDKVWALTDVAEVLFGKRGDTRIYRVELPEAETGRYSTAEVKGIVENWNPKKQRTQSK